MSLEQNFLNAFVNKWFDLLSYCGSETFDQKEFKRSHDEWAKRWSRLDWEQQGYITEQISKSV